jgi:phage terminase large subunit
MDHHARVIRDLTADEPVLYTVADSSEPQAIADLRRLGVPCLEAKRDRRAGRMLVGDYLRSGRLTFVKGACPWTIKELHHYRWDKDKNKEGAKEATLGDDHAMDALRYAVMSRPTPGHKVIRPPTNTFRAVVRQQTERRLRGQWATLTAAGGR